MESSASNPMSTFVGVGCPGAFEGRSTFSENFGQHGQNILNFFTDNNIKHITSRELGMRLEEECGLLDIKCVRAADSLQQDEEENRISRDLGFHYLNSITNTNDSQPGNELQISELTIIYGQHPRVFGANVEPNSDGVVTREDAEGILVAVNATTENIEQIGGVNHRELVNDERTENLIRRRLR